MGVLVGDRQQRGVCWGVLALVRVSAVGRWSDSLETAGVGADSFNSTDSSMHTRLLDGGPHLRKRRDLEIRCVDGGGRR